MTDQQTLFDLDQVPKTDKTCLTCEHRERHACGASVFQYCGVRSSNLTYNGKLKIKCKTPACLQYSPYKPEI